MYSFSPYSHRTGYKKHYLYCKQGILFCANNAKQICVDHVDLTQQNRTMHWTESYVFKDYCAAEETKSAPQTNCHVMKYKSVILL